MQGAYAAIGRFCSLCSACLLLFPQIKDPDKYNFKPKELLAQICSIYLNMDRGDRKGVFAAAVAADKRSYRSQMFPEAANVLRQFGLLTQGERARGGGGGGSRMRGGEGRGGGVPRGRKHMRRRGLYVGARWDGLDDEIGGQQGGGEGLCNAGIRTEGGKKLSVGSVSRDWRMMGGPGCASA